MDTAVSVEEVRQRTRAAQHATSFPLLVLGVLFINYGVVGFAPQPTAWRYAGALAFVIMWALGKANEYTTGVGPGRGGAGPERPAQGNRWRGDPPSHGHRARR